MVFLRDLYKVLCYFKYLLTFFLYLSDRIYSTYLYADDTTIYDIKVDIYELRSNLQNSLLELHRWCQQNGMVLTTEKTKVMFITTQKKRLHIDENILMLSFDDIDLQITTGDKNLGVYIDENLRRTNHYQAVCKKYLIISDYCLNILKFILI